MTSLPLSTPQYRWLAVLWTGGIVAACSIPATSLSTLGPALSADKAIHFGLFAIFGLLWMRALGPPGASPALRRRSLFLLGGGGLFAAGTEVYQHLMPLQRQGDPYDALANGAGLLAAVVAYALLVRSRAAPDHAR
jgi:hypothetical protein